MPGCPMMISDKNVQGSDTTGDDSSNADGKLIIMLQNFEQFAIEESFQNLSQIFFVVAE